MEEVKTREFKAESKRLLDLMINSIYTHKEIFLRELISNCSDALDKQHFASLTDSSIKQEEFCINIQLDKAARTLTISDNGCGMNMEELEDNLGTIAKSGTLAFKKEHDEGLIGQFGVGFYSAFMVADGITVISKKQGEDDAYRWVSHGADGYTLEKWHKDSAGTTIILNIKPNDKEYNYESFLNSENISTLVKKYSDYIRYPIKMEFEVKKPKTESKAKKGKKTANEPDATLEPKSEVKILNSMVPIWKKPKKDVTKEDYDEFYQGAFHDFMPPMRVISAKLEGTLSYNTLLFVPKKTPFNYNSKDYEKGLRLYSDGVLIMERCKDLLPDYLGFIKGLVDSSDLSLNISREMLQKDRQLKSIAASLEKKLIAEFKKMLNNERDEYEKMFAEFASSIKFGAYDNFGEKKEQLKDLLLFYTSFGDKMSTFAEYVSRQKEGQDTIYYACGESAEKIEKMPQCEKIISDGYEILYLTDSVDEFVIKMLEEYDGKKFKSVADSGTFKDEESDEQDAVQNNKELLYYMKTVLKGKVKDVTITSKLKSHAACISADGDVSLEMEKVFAAMSKVQNTTPLKAQKILELNPHHSIFTRLTYLIDHDKDKLADYTKVLFDTAMLAQGFEIEDGAEYSALVQKLL